MVRTKTTSRKSGAGTSSRAQLTSKLGPRKQVPSTGGPKKQQRNKPGAVARCEVKRLQKSTEPLIPKLPLERVVREVAYDIRRDRKFKSDALSALQEAVESHLVGHFMDSRSCAKHAKRKTVKPKDSQLAARLAKGQ